MASTDVVLASVEVIEDLSPQEEQDRQHLELKVERAFYEAGCALRELRYRKLYRSSHKNWEDYCKDRFGFGRDAADVRILAAGVVEDLKKMPMIHRQILPTTLEQVIPLPKGSRLYEQLIHVS